MKQHEDKHAALEKLVVSRHFVPLDAMVYRLGWCLACADGHDYPPGLSGHLCIDTPCPARVQDEHQQALAVGLTVPFYDTHPLSFHLGRKFQRETTDNALKLTPRFPIWQVEKETSVFGTKAIAIIVSVSGVVVFFSFRMWFHSKQSPSTTTTT